MRTYMKNRSLKANFKPISSEKRSLSADLKRELMQWFRSDILELETLTGIETGYLNDSN